MLLKAFSNGKNTAVFAGFSGDNLVWLGMHGLGMDGRPFAITGLPVEDESGSFRLYSRASASSASFPNDQDAVQHHVGHCTAKLEGDSLTISYAVDTLEFGFDSVPHFSPMPERFQTGQLTFGRLA